MLKSLLKQALESTANDIDLNDGNWEESDIQCGVCGSYLYYNEFEDEYFCPGCRMCMDIEQDSDIPSGCAACGGPYPLCKDGCPLFDKD